MAQKKQRYSFIGDGLTPKQKAEGREICKEYRSNYNVENYAQFQLLEELIFREIQQKSVKQKMANLMKSENVKEKNLIPRSQWQALDDNLDKILDLKERLGMIGDDDEKTFYSKYTALHEKYQKWVMAHKADYSFKCPHCEKWVMAYIDLRKYGKVQHPHFRGQIIYNETLWQLWRDEKITADEIAKILNVSVEYIPYLEEELYGKKTKKQEDVEEESIT